MESLEIPEKQKSFFKSILQAYNKVFADKTGCCSVYCHKLDMHPDTPTMNPKERQIPYGQKPEVKKHIDKWKEEKIITSEGSPFISPLTIVIKPNGELRPCLDSRAINKWMRTRGDTVPPIEVLKTKFTNSRVFSKIDFRSGFLQIPLHSESRKYVAFRLDGEPFVFNRVAFGLKDSMQAFIAALREVLKDLDYCVAVYVDDVLIHSPNVDQHIADLGEVIKRIAEAGMTLRLDKCSFFKDSAKFLGFIISVDGVVPDPKRVESIYQYREPTSVTEVKSFLGVINYYRNHVPCCAEIAAPLHQLTQGNRKFQWTNVEQKSFDDLKAAMAEATMQAHPDWSKPFYILTDASKFAVSGLVAQFDDENNPRILSAVSRLVKKAEMNYATHEKELLAVIYTIKKNSYILVGHELIVNLDNRALKYLYSIGDDVSDRISRWRLYLMQFNIVCIEHIPGKQNTAPDALSRFRKDIYKNSQRLDAHRQILFENANFIQAAPCMLLLTQQGLRIDQILDNIVDLQADCPQIQAARCRPSPRIMLRGDTVCWKNRDGSDRILAPYSIRKFLIQFYHEEYTHPGSQKTLSIIRRYFDWPGSKNEVENYVFNCITCKTNKYKNSTLQGEFQSVTACLLYTSPSPRDRTRSRMPSSA